MSLRATVEAHATACREAVATGRERPLWAGGSLAMAYLVRANLSGANLSGANLFGTALSGADLIGADLRGADLRYVNLFGTNFTGANLARANLFGTNFTGANLARANLSGANLSGADLYWVTLTEADLTEADLMGAYLMCVHLSGADLTGARLAEGVARGRAIGGRAGGYVWWAVALEGGDILLQYGCERRLLSWWLTQGPELSVYHDHPPEHWEQGPAVAIAAAVELSQAQPAGVRR